MRIGIGERDITPDRPVYLTGFAARTDKSEGSYAPLKARVMALDDGCRKLIWVTADILGFYYDLAPRVYAAVRSACGVTDDEVLLSASHTHCGPALREMDEWRWGPGAVDGYDAELAAWVAEAAREAVDDVREGTLHLGLGRCPMAISRRLPVDGVAQFRPNPAGVVDHELPVLLVREPDGRPRAALVSYACHPTTMGGQLAGPDYVGFLRDGVERAVPGLKLLFANGCGADAKPNSVTPDGRFAGGPLSEVQRCGAMVAESALAVLGGPLAPITGRIESRRTVIELPLQPVRPRAVYEAAAAGSDRHLAQWGRDILASLDSGVPPAMHREFVVQATTIGDELCLVALGGEVCAAIGLRLKRELGGRFRHLLLVAYSHGMFGYQAARRQFAEGGYEVERWSQYSWMPAPFAPDLEDLIVTAAVALAKRPAA